ncbi:MAG: UDP-N-acetylmuramoyl-tripeptide--D-alanyl-D-alanine ligase, partial [Clostridia bacterium]|nr:UDP-N-acetylmuramoyl-tripeptide--D-alanyl-D-alanine ligase [Clostridia bacterium]
LCGDPDTKINNVQYDSRAVSEGTLFVPIKGARVDAHRFIEDCLSNGASASFTENDAPKGAVKPYIKVNDTLTALQKLAGSYRNTFHIRLIGVTGSVGKTSTKEMIAAALSKGFDIMKTQGNKNSQIGMPMTMFDIQDSNEAAVIEMGMSEFGEMERLCSVAQPNIAVITNIGTAHIENLKTQENIMREKLKITNSFDENGVLFINGDDKLLKTLHHKQKFRTVTFGLNTECDYYADNIRNEDFHTRFVCHHNGKSSEYTIPALGVHNVTNALVAVAIGELLGLSAETIQNGLLTYQNAPMRQQIHRLKDFVLIDDSYNASPEATVVSLDVLKSIAAERSIAVLADMLELGEEAESLHYNVGTHLAQIHIDTLITVGELSKFTAKGAKENGCSDVHSFDTNTEAYEYLFSRITPNSTILVKGSRGMHTDEIVSKIIKK